MKESVKVDSQCSPDIQIFNFLFCHKVSFGASSVFDNHNILYVYDQIVITFSLC